MQSLVDSKTLFIFTTASDTGIRVALEMARAGVEVVVHCSQVHFCCVVRELRTIHPGRGQSLVAGILKSLHRETPHVVIPCDDAAVRALHSIYREHPGWRSLIQFSLGSPQCFEAVSKRAGLFEELASLPGVSLPEWAPVRSESDLQMWVSRMGEETTVFKREVSSGGSCVCIALGTEQMQMAYLQMKTPSAFITRFTRKIVNLAFNFHSDVYSQERRNGVVQRYIKGRRANCAVFCREGEVLASISMEVLASESETSPSTTVRYIEHDGMQQTVVTSARRLGLSGFHAFDFILEENNSRAWLLELNPRVTPTAHLPFGDGHDLVEACVKTVCLLRTYGRSSLPQDVVALFPRELKRNPESEYLKTAYHDIDWACPELVLASIRRMQHKDFYGRVARCLHFLRKLRANPISAMRLIRKRAFNVPSL
jgi:hypothetical protein